MKAYLISEKLDFERGGDPKEVMGLGLKTRFLKLFPDISLDGGFGTEWKKIKQIIHNPTTQISFETDPKIPNKNRIILTLPENSMNYFFFASIQSIIDAHSPKIIQGIRYDDTQMIFYFYN